MSAIKTINYAQLPAIELKTTDGAHAIVTFFGAQVVSWTSPDAVERLFCSTRAVLDGSKSIRGGIPVIFPQFGAHGDGLRHGFARMCDWRLADNGYADTAGKICFAEFVLNETDLPSALASGWPNPFSLRLRVTLAADALDITLQVNNTGDMPFAFCSALHTYWRTQDVGSVSIEGLQGARFSDYTNAPMVTGVQSDAVLRLSGKLDRIYHRIANDLVLSEGSNRLRLHQTGFADAVVWNPGADDAAALSDMADDEYLSFICIEAAMTDSQSLAAAAQWQGHHRISLIP